MKAEKARLDADKTATPKTKLVRQHPAGACIGPQHGATHVDHEDGSRTPLYVPRNERPARKEALAALERYLARYPDLRIGQALWAIATHDPFHLEDEDIIARVEPAETIGD